MSLLLAIYEHPITQKYLNRSGMAHATCSSLSCFPAWPRNITLIQTLQQKQAFYMIWATLHGIMMVWDYELYSTNDIHSIKGAERAHKLLIRLGENPVKAKVILPRHILFHTDSFLPPMILSVLHFSRSLNGPMRKMKK